MTYEQKPETEKNRLDLNTSLNTDQNKPHFDKLVVREKFKQQLTKMRDNYRNSANDASSMAREADGAMQSRYDTTKVEQSWLANALGNLGNNLDQILTDWDALLPSEQSNQVDIGSVVFLKDLEYGDEEWFYLIPFAGGITIKIDEEEIRGLSIESILGKNLSGKEKGQQIKYKARPDDIELQRFKILEIL